MQTSTGKEKIFIETILKFKVNWKFKIIKKSLKFLFKLLKHLKSSRK